MRPQALCEHVIGQEQKAEKLGQLTQGQSGLQKRRLTARRPGSARGSPVQDNEHWRSLTQGTVSSLHQVHCQPGSETSLDGTSFGFTPYL